MFILLTMLFAFAPTSQPADRGPTLRVMTFNLRFASDVPPNDWKVRRPVTKATIERQLPDLIGTQEGLDRQLQDIDADLGKTYARVGQARKGGTKDEFSCLYYRVDRFELIAHDDFWLSDKPDEVGSIAWGAKLPRMVTHAQLRDRATGHTLDVFNTHFDHSSEEARRNSATLLASRVNALPADARVIVTGDFNASNGASPAYDTLTADGVLRDTWTDAKDVGPAVGSFHNFGPIFPKAPRIDWILYRGKATVHATFVDTFRVGEQAPSDHCPVVADLTFE